MVRKLYISGDAWNPDSQEAGTHTGGNGNAGEVKNYEECPYSRELGTRGISICCFSSMSRMLYRGIRMVVIPNASQKLLRVEFESAS